MERRGSAHISGRRAGAAGRPAESGFESAARLTRGDPGRCIIDGWCRWNRSICRFFRSLSNVELLRAHSGYVSAHEGSAIRPVWLSDRLLIHYSVLHVKIIIIRFICNVAVFFRTTVKSSVFVSTSDSACYIKSQHWLSMPYIFLRFLCPHQFSLFSFCLFVDFLFSSLR